MSQQHVKVRELSAWGFDEFSARGEDVRQNHVAAVAERFEALDPRQPHHALLADPSLQEQRTRADLLREMDGLEWDLAVVELRHLLAFQRRLSFDPSAPAMPLAASDQPSELLRICFGPPKPVQYTSLAIDAQQLEFRSADPNFHLRLSPHADVVTHSSGSPFLEVAEYRGRWFLRDGYHRAYHLLRAGIHRVPAVAVRAKTLAELGAEQPWSFSEAVLFSARPPRVADFLDDALTTVYARLREIKTVRLTIHTSYSTEETQETK